MPKRRINLTGQTFGKLLAISHFNKDGIAWWKCKCDCGNTHEIRQSSLTKKEGTKSCGCITRNYIINKNKQRRTGYRDVTGNYISQVRYNAKIRNLEYNLTPKYLYELYTLQNKRCIYSNVGITFGQKRMADTTASLDRIDPGYGYIEGNVQWVHKIINIMKNSMTSKDFTKWCKLVTDNKGVK